MVCLKSSRASKNDIFESKKSRYNKKTIVYCCEICNSKNNLETHHIEFQQNSDKYGFIIKNDKEHVSVHHTSNLVILCDKCHDKVHNNLLYIEGYEETVKGNILKIKIIKKNNEKYSDNEISFIKSFKDKKINQKNIKKHFDEHFDKKISLKEISNILKI